MFGKGAQTGGGKSRSRKTSQEAMMSSTRVVPVKRNEMGQLQVRKEVKSDGLMTGK